MNVSTVEGPYFDELRHGDVFDTAPAMTLTEGGAALHQSVVGNRLRLTLNGPLSRRVLGHDGRMAPPALVWDVAIGQSTPVTHHVKANLFYRGLVFRRAPVLGDTLRTSSEIVGLRQNSSKPGRPATGLVALRITTVDQEDRTVLDFWRCAMLPLRDPRGRTGLADDLDQVGGEVTPRETAGLARGWRLDAFRDELPESLLRDVDVGTVWDVVGGDVVSGAPELARLTLNLARTHHDDSAGTRLVYGGHTVGVALSQATRALPEMVTVVAWHGCDHLGPVWEGDTLSSSVEVEAAEPGPGGGRLRHLRSRVMARSGPGEQPRPVLDWRYVALFA